MSCRYFEGIVIGTRRRCRNCIHYSPRLAAEKQQYCLSKREETK